MNCNYCTNHYDHQFVVNDKYKQQKQNDVNDEEKTVCTKIGNAGCESKCKITKPAKQFLL